MGLGTFLEVGQLSLHGIDGGVHPPGPNPLEQFRARRQGSAVQQQLAQQRLEFWSCRADVHLLPVADLTLHGGKRLGKPLVGEIGSCQPGDIAGDG